MKKLILSFVVAGALSVGMTSCKSETTSTETETTVTTDSTVTTDTIKK